MYDNNEWHAWTHADGLGADNGMGYQPSRNTGLGTRNRHDLGVLSGGQATYNPNYVFSIHVTPEDHVWAGTWGGGVSHFDGERWTNYTTADGLVGNIVFEVVQEADNGALWFGTNNGISRFHQGKWQNFGFSQGLLDLNVYSWSVSAAGDIWAGTKGAVYRIAMPAPAESGSR